jgi:hypothetical protein
VIEVKIEKPGAPKAPTKSRYGGRGGFNHRKPATDKALGFEGRCDSLKGFVFYCSDGKQLDGYNTMMKKIIGYVGREYVNGGDIISNIEYEVMFQVEVPKDPVPKEGETAASATSKRIWERQINELVKRENRLASNCQSDYSLILGQCSEVMVASLQSLKGFKAMNQKFDLLELMKSIKGLIYNFDGQRYHPMSLHLATKCWYSMYQGRDVSNAYYLEKLSTSLAMVEQFGGELGVDSGEVKSELALKGIYLHRATDNEMTVASIAARGKCLAVAFLAGTDKQRYGRLIEELENDYSKGMNNYPVTLTSAYKLILNYRNYQRPASRVFNDSEAVNFANVEKWVVDRTKVRCFNCSVMGHYANECTEPKKENDSGYTEGTANAIIGADGDE